MLPDRVSLPPTAVADTNNPRAILHVDMDQFFAAVEILDNPFLADKPLLIAHDSARGVVSTASYPARKFGCKSAQPTALAKRLCPQALIIQPRHSRYREISAKVFDIFERYTPVIEPLSIDEAFLDITGSVRALGSPLHIARQIKSTIFSELGLNASVGVAHNKFLAKVASDLRKPDALVHFTHHDVQTLLPTLPVTRIWGIGPKAAARLANLNIKTIADIQRLSQDDLQRRFGSEATRYFNLARGIDHRPVNTDHQAKSIGHETTFPENVIHPEQLRQVVFNQAEQVGWRLRKAKLHARAATIKIRFGQFKTITRQCTFPDPTQNTTDIFNATVDLFNQWAQTAFQPVRLIGIAVKQLSHSIGQLSLFTNPEDGKQQKMDNLVDHINQRLGKNTMRRGAGLGND